MKPQQLLPGIVIVLATLLIAGGCSEEDLPSSPPPPYLFTSLALSSDTQPRPGTPLTAGQTIRVQYAVSYTLDPPTFEQRAQLAIYVNILGVINDTTTVEIGNFPDREFRLDLQGEARPDTLSFTVPAGVAQVWMQAFLDTLPISNPVMELDQVIWPVR